MLYVALHLPQLALEAFCATLDEAQRQRPVALLREHRVDSVNAAAAQRGVRPGQQRATALTLAADLLLADSEPAREMAALRAVAYAALAYTPAVSLQGAPRQPGVAAVGPLPGDHTVLLEVQGSLRLFGGLRALCRRLQQDCAALGHRLQWAAAPTALGAALLARWHPADRGDLLFGPHVGLPGAPAGAAPPPAPAQALQELLGQAPVWLLGPGREHWEALQGMGLHTLADLQALPRSGLARRFGQGLLDALDQALGRRPDPQALVPLPPRFEARLELAALAQDTEQLLPAAMLLLHRLLAWARARQGRVAAFTLRLLHERQRQAPAAPTELQLALAEPSLDPAHLQLLLRERLARCTLRAPALEVQLLCRHLVALPPPNGELFPTRAAHDQGMAQLIERLCARLGEDRVLHLVPVADHRPEKASAAQPMPAATAAPPGAAHWPLHRPVWLWPEPLPLAQHQHLPVLEGRPLALVSGPERLETGWWDQQPVARDYFIAVAHDGSLLWLFRSRLPGTPAEAGWFLHGRFG